MTRNDYGASHNFKHEEVSKKKNKIHGYGEPRISKTIYFKYRHFQYVNFYAEGEEITVSEAFDDIIQCGIAWKAQIKAQDEEKRKMNGNRSNDKFDLNLSIVRER